MSDKTTENGGFYVPPEVADRLIQEIAYALPVPVNSRSVLAHWKRALKGYWMWHRRHGRWSIGAYRRWKQEPGKLDLSKIDFERWLKEHRQG